MEFTLDELADFLVEAKTNAWASDSGEVVSAKPGFKKHVYSRGDWRYEDEYAGFYQAPGSETVFYKNKPVWMMCYSGGMEQEFHGNEEFSKNVFSFLKLALKQVKKSRPFRGNSYFKISENGGTFEYFDSSDGDVARFKGTELILYNVQEVFRQDYIGCLIISK